MRGMPAIHMKTDVFFAGSRPVEKIQYRFGAIMAMTYPYEIIRGLGDDAQNLYEFLRFFGIISDHA